MKKIITLAFFIGTFATSFAQYNHQTQYAYSLGANFNGHNKDWKSEGLSRITTYSILSSILKVKHYKPVLGQGAQLRLILRGKPGNLLWLFES